MSAQPDYGIMPGGQSGTPGAAGATGTTGAAASPALSAAPSAVPPAPSPSGAPVPSAVPPLPPRPTAPQELPHRSSATPAPQAPARPGEASAPSSPEEIQAALNARRAALAADAEALGERLAPAAVRAVASQRASTALAAARGRAEDAGARARAFVDAHRHDSPTQVAKSAATRVKRFLDDAADGDPLALGVVSLVGAALAGGGITGLVRLARADRRQAFPAE